MCAKPWRVANGGQTLGVLKALDIKKADPCESACGLGVGATYNNWEGNYMMRPTILLSSILKKTLVVIY